MHCRFVVLKLYVTVLIEIGLCVTKIYFSSLVVFLYVIWVWYSVVGFAYGSVIQNSVRIVVRIPLSLHGIINRF